MMQTTDIKRINDDNAAPSESENVADAGAERVSTEPTSRARCEEIFLANLSVIQRLIATVGRQHRLSPDDAEEFAAVAQMRIISDNYAVLRKFRGQCTLRTFLTVVIQRMCLDFLAAQWGKWRPSVRSRRAGDVAILLERLTMRDGLTFEEACSVLECNHGLSLERDTLGRIHGGFRARCRPRFVTDEELAEMPAVLDGPGDGVVAAEHERVVRHAAEELTAALAALAPQDRLILQMRYADGIHVTQIARMLNLDHKWLFRRLDRLFAALRKTLESRGLRGTDVLPALDRSEGHAVDVFGNSAVETRPSGDGGAAQPGDDGGAGELRSH